MGGFVGPQGTIDQSTAMFGGIGAPLGSVIGPSPSYTGGFFGPQGQSISQSDAMFGGPGAPLGSATDTNNSMFGGMFGGMFGSVPSLGVQGLGVPSVSDFGGFGGGFGGVTDTGTFGGMYGPGQMANRGDWSGDVATSGPGLGGALSDAFGATNWAGSWNGVDATGRNLGWGPGLADPDTGVINNASIAARNLALQQSSTPMGWGFVGPGGQAISAATAMFGGPGAPLGSVGLGGGWGGGGGPADGGGGSGGAGGGGYNGTGMGGGSNVGASHSGMGDASF
jgi:hypothetical protein